MEIFYFSEWYYRRTPDPQKIHIIIAEITAGVAWWWFLWNMYHEFDVLLKVSNINTICTILITICIARNRSEYKLILFKVTVNCNNVTNECVLILLFIYMIYIQNNSIIDELKDNAAI